MVGNPIVTTTGSSAQAVIEDPEEIKPYNEDWLKKLKGNCKLVLKPRTTEEVSQLLKHCNQRQLAVVPQGGNTGTSMGNVV